MEDIATDGVSFAGQVALATGAGRGSICIEIVKALLQVGRHRMISLVAQSRQG